METTYFLSSWSIVIVWASGLVIITTFIRSISKTLDTDLNLEARNDIALRLMCWQDVKVNNWIPDFSRIFDHFFGSKHIAFRCFLRSSIISLGSFLFAFLLVFSLNSEYILESMSQYSYAFIGAIVLNVIFDYFSLLETRVILNKKLSISVKLLLDFLLTLLIASIWMFMLFLIVIVSQLDFGFDIILDNSILIVGEILQTGYKNILLPFGKNVDADIFKIFLATSFSTSVWLWLHGLSQYTIKLLSATQKIMNFLNVEEQPIRAIGVVINGYIFLFGMILYPIYYWVF